MLLCFSTCFLSTIATRTINTCSISSRYAQCIETITHIINSKVFSIKKVVKKVVCSNHYNKRKFEVLFLFPDNCFDVVSSSYLAFDARMSPFHLLDPCTRTLHSSHLFFIPFYALTIHWRAFKSIDNTNEHFSPFTHLPAYVDEVLFFHGAGFYPLEPDLPLICI